MRKIMEDFQKTGNATPNPVEDKELEEALSTNEEEVRQKIVEDYGLNEDEQKDLVDKLTQKEIEQRKAFGKVIEQKRKWRDQAQTKPEENKEGNTSQPPKQGEDIRAIIREEFNQKYIEDLQYPDEVKDEIKRIAKDTGKDAKEVANDPYILYKKREIEKEQKNTEASPDNMRKGSAVGDEKSPPKFDLSTEEGRKAAKEWRDSLKKQ